MDDLTASPPNRTGRGPGTRPRDPSVGDLIAEPPRIVGRDPQRRPDARVCPARPATSACVRHSPRSPPASTPVRPWRPAGHRPSSPRRGGCVRPVFGTPRRRLPGARRRAGRGGGGESSTRVIGLGSRGDGWDIGARSYDGVVLAVPAREAADCSVITYPNMATALAVVEPAGSAVVSITAAAGTEAPDHSGVLVATGEPLHAKAFTFSSQKGRTSPTAGWCRCGHSFGRYGQPVTAADQLVTALDDLDQGHRRRMRRRLVASRTDAGTTMADGTAPGMHPATWPG